MLKQVWVISASLLISNAAIAAEKSGFVAEYDVQIQLSQGQEGGTDGVLTQSMTVTCDDYIFEQFMDFTLTPVGAPSMAMASRFAYQESRDGKSYSFDANQIINDKLIEESAGSALRGSNDVPIVRYKRPARKDQILPRDVYFPAGLMYSLIDQFKTGESYFSEQVFDGTSEKSLYRVSGLRLPERYLPVLEENAPGYKVLKDQAGWMLDVAWYEIVIDQKVDSSPQFRVRMDIYENGISRNLQFIYPNMQIHAQLNSLKMLPATKC